MSPHLTRRDFVGAAGLAIGGSLFAPAAVAQPDSDTPAPGAPVILFQGDSITDASRNRAQPEPNRPTALGTGYPLLLASALLADHPRRNYQVFNRGISGNKVPDLQARWDADAIALKPDILSILIGVNDIWHKLNGQYAGTTASYESGFTALLEDTRRRLPGTRLVILEPFVLRVGAVNDRWFPEFTDRQAAAARVARRAGAIWVPLQGVFDRLARQAGPAHWAADGVHPTPAGHEVIADRWRRAVDL